MRTTFPSAAALVLASILASCESSTSSSDTQGHSPQDSSVAVGGFVVKTSYEGADTLPTVALKVLEAQLGQGPVDVTIRNTSKASAAVTVSVGIQDYTSSPGVVTKTVGPGESATISPMIFIAPDKLKTLSSYTQSNYQVKVTAATSEGEKVLLQETHLVNLMARDAMPWVWSGVELSPFVTLFVTPTNDAVQTFLAKAKGYTSSNSFVGYQDTRIDSGVVVDTISAPSVGITPFFRGVNGHGVLSVSYKSDMLASIWFEDSTGKTLFNTKPATVFPESTYSFESGTWGFSSYGSIGQVSKVAYTLKYWYASGSVRDQVRAIYNALKAEGISYSSTTISFPEGSQKIRFPEDALNQAAANCIDGTVLIASALEAIDLEPLIIMVPGHAFLGWRDNAGSESAEFLETTMIGSATFEEAMAEGLAKFRHYDSTGDAMVIDVKKARAEGLFPAARAAR